MNRVKVEKRGRGNDRLPPTPHLASLAPDGLTVTIFWSENVTIVGTFTLAASGGVANLSYASGSGTTQINLTSDRTIIQGESLTLSGPEGVVVDLKSNPNAEFAIGVANGSTQTLPPPDVTAPIPTAIEVLPGGLEVRFHFSEPVTGGTGLSLTADGTTIEVSVASGAGTDTLHFVSPAPSAFQVYSGQTVTADYAPGSITDLAGNALEAFSDFPVLNGSQATPSSVSINSMNIDADGTVLTVSLSAPTTIASAAGWSLEFDNYAERVLAYSSGSGTNTLLFAISANPTYTDENTNNDAAPVGAVCTLSYDSGAGNVVGLADVTDQSVTNNSTVIPDPDLPEQVDASLPANWDDPADHTPANQAELQALLNDGTNNGTENDWTIIELASDGTNYGPLTIDDACEYILIRTDAYASLPAYGNRLLSTDDGNGYLATISRAPTQGSHISLTVSKGTGASGAEHIRFVGIKIGMTGTFTTDVTRMCAVGEGGPTDFSEHPTHIGFDRCLFTAVDAVDIRDVLRMDATDSFAIGCRFENLDGAGNDGTTGIRTYIGARLKYHNNYFETESAAIFLGDNFLTRADDVTISNNYSTRDLEWNDGNGNQKAGLLETKVGKRILVENCSVNNVTWSSFNAITIKADGAGGPKNTSHVTIRYVKINNSSGGGIQLHVNGSSPGAGVGPNHDMLVHDCLIYDITHPLALTLVQKTGFERIKVRNNTILHADTRLWFTGGSHLRFFDNIVDIEVHGIDNSGQFVGTGAIAFNTTYGSSYNAQYNAFITESIGNYDDDISPAPLGTLDNNLFPASIAAVQFEDVDNDDYRLGAGSPLLAASSAGGPIGCDVAGLNTRLSGVEE